MFNPASDLEIDGRRLENRFKLLLEYLNNKNVDVYEVDARKSQNHIFQEVVSRLSC